MEIPKGLLTRHRSSQLDDSDNNLGGTDTAAVPTTTTTTNSRAAEVTTAATAHPWRQDGDSASSSPPLVRRHRPFASSLTMDGSASTALEEELNEIGKLEPFTPMMESQSSLGSTIIPQGIKKRSSPATTSSEDYNDDTTSTSAAIEKFEDEESVLPFPMKRGGGNHQDSRVGENNGDASPFKKKKKKMKNRFENLHNMPCYGWIIMNVLIAIVGTCVVLSVFYWKDGSSNNNNNNNNKTAASLPLDAAVVKMTSSVLGLEDVPEEDTTEAPIDDNTVAPTDELIAPVVGEGGAAVEETTASEASTTTTITTTTTTAEEEDGEDAAGVGFSDVDRRTIRRTQINNFKNNNGAIILNVLIQSHGGTTVRREFQNVLQCPSFACLHATPEEVGNDYPENYPWKENVTSQNIQKVRNHFGFIMWQFAGPPPIDDTQIQETYWEDPKLVSILVIREPLSRAMAGNAIMGPKYPNILTHHPETPATREQWMAFANEPYHTNNYALRILSDETCCDGKDTPRHYLEQAKELVKRFTFVLDINCLVHSLDRVSELLGIQNSHFYADEDNVHDHTSAKDRIPYPDVYDYLVERNKLDIELYEFAKSRALLDCDAVYAAEAAMKAAMEGNGDV